ncbi:MAG: hypothetical protein HFE64_01640 [Lachnospiraceae bacterium]|jgi:hypothetical protein|nr:hypothetical protein [Lachnospiraceae bacterium]
MHESKGVTIEYIARSLKGPFAGGEIRITVQESRGAGQCFYTRRIDTGLGPGRHEISLHLADEMGIDEKPLESRRILYGDSQVFHQSSYIPGVPEAKLAACLEEETGYLQIGIRLESPMPAGTLCLIWQARKEELMTEKEETAAKAQLFYIANPPKSLRPGMKYTFSCRKADTLQGTVQWKVIGENAGTINQYGAYTAPDRQGVFEIQASLQGTDQTATAYVMIKE